MFGGYNQNGTSSYVEDPLKKDFDFSIDFVNYFC